MILRDVGEGTGTGTDYCTPWRHVEQATWINSRTAVDDRRMAGEDDPVAAVSNNKRRIRANPRKKPKARHNEFAKQGGWPLEKHTEATNSEVVLYLVRQGARSLGLGLTLVH
jgi:hypothetical protein